MRHDDNRRFWEQAVSALARRINTVAWLERFTLPAFASCCVGAGFVYALRRFSEPLSVGLWGLGAVLIGLGAFALWRARGSFFNRKDARALLEYQLGLDSALSAAAAGVGQWPPRRANTGWLRWRAWEPLGWLAAGGVVLAAGLFVPVPTQVPGFARATEPPPALAQTEAWLEQVNQLALAEPESLEALNERARGLAGRDSENQYTHSALEAADTLRSQTEAAIRSLADQLDSAAGALAPLENPAAALSDEELGALAARLGAALQGMREGRLAANPELLKSLPAATAAGLRSLSPEQASRLREQLSRAGRAATGVVGAEGKGASVASADPNGKVSLRRGAGVGGDGTPERGPGHAPLYLSELASDAGSGRTETLSSDDLARAALGDLLGTERGQHELDPAKSVAPSSAGAIAAPGRGGEVVWVDHLTPAERAALKDFFK